MTYIIQRLIKKEKKLSFYEQSTKYNTYNQNKYMSQPRMQISELNDLKARMLMKVNQKSFMVFGPRNVGKSTLISRFLIDHIFEEKRDFAQEGIRKLMMQYSLYHQQISYKNIRFEVEVLDTASYDPYFTFLASKHGAGISGYILMYDPTQPDSAATLQNMLDKLFSINGKNKPAVLLGNINLQTHVNATTDGSFLVSDEEMRALSVRNQLPWLQLDVKNCPQKDIRTYIQNIELIDGVFNKLVVEIFKEEFKVKKEVKLMKQPVSIAFLVSLLLQLLFGVCIIVFAAFLTKRYPEKLIYFEGSLLLFILLCVGLLFGVAAILAVFSLRKRNREIFCSFQLLIVVCGCLSAGGLVIDLEPNGLFKESATGFNQTSTTVSHRQLQMQVGSVLVTALTMSIAQFILGLFVGAKIRPQN